MLKKSKYKEKSIFKNESKLKRDIIDYFLSHHQLDEKYWVEHFTRVIKAFHLRGK